MDKPKPKTEVSIVSIIEDHRHIIFHASADAAQDFSEFGYIHASELTKSYWLFVDFRYDFDEVINYIRNYG